MPAREPWPGLVLYHLFKWPVVAPTFWWYLRGRVEGFEYVPRRGAFVAVCNHASDFDPPLVSCALGRPVAYMAKAELFQVPVLATLIRWYGAFPVQRGTSDRQAIQAALTALRQGWATGIFLSGTRTPDGRVTEPKLGAALIAAKAQVPLLPVMLWGTQHIRPPGCRWPRSTPVTIRIAPPLAPPADTQRAHLTQVTWDCCRILNQLHDQGR